MGMITGGHPPKQRLHLPGCDPRLRLSAQKKLVRRNTQNLTDPADRLYGGTILPRSKSDANWLEMPTASANSSLVIPWVSRADRMRPPISIFSGLYICLMPTAPSFCYVQNIQSVSSFAVGIALKLYCALHAILLYSMQFRR